MALTAYQIAELIKMRGTGHSQAEIGARLGVSQQVVAYNLKKLRKEAEKKGPFAVFDDSLARAGFLPCTAHTYFDDMMWTYNDIFGVRRVIENGRK